jgi:hypothetical protein
MCIRLLPLLMFKRFSLDDPASQERLDVILKGPEIAPNRQSKWDETEVPVNICNVGTCTSQ